MKTQSIIKSIAEMVFNDASLESQNNALNDYCNENHIDISRLKDNLTAFVKAVRDYREFELRHAKQLAEELADGCHVTKDELEVLMNGTMEDLGLKEEEPRKETEPEEVEPKKKEQLEAEQEDKAEQHYAKGKDCLAHGDYFGAIRWFKDAVRMEYGEAAFSLGNMYYFGNPAIEKDEDAAMRWYEEAVLLGCVAAEEAIKEIAKKRKKAVEEASRKQREKEEAERKAAEAEHKRREMEEAERKKQAEKRKKAEAERKKQEEERKKAEAQQKQKTKKYLSFQAVPSRIVVTDIDVFVIVRDEIRRLGPGADLNHIDVSRVTTFYDDYEHEGLFEGTDFYGDVSKWNVSKVTDMRYAFAKCTKFNGDLSHWDVSKVEVMTGMFYHCERFEGKGLEDWVVNANDKSMHLMFKGCNRIDPDELEWFEDIFGEGCVDDRLDPMCKYFDSDYTRRWVQQRLKK